MLQAQESMTEIKFVSMSFWFWVKAGAGFAIGIGLVMMVSWFMWLLFFINILTGLVRSGPVR